MHLILNFIQHLATIIGYIVLGYFLLWFLYYLKHWRCVKCSFGGHRTMYKVIENNGCKWYTCYCKQAASSIQGDYGGWKTHLWSTHP